MFCIPQFLEKDVSCDIPHKQSKPQAIPAAFIDSMHLQVDRRLHDVPFHLGPQAQWQLSVATLSSLLTQEILTDEFSHNKMDWNKYKYDFSVERQLGGQRYGADISDSDTFT